MRPNSEIIVWEGWSMDIVALSNVVIVSECGCRIVLPSSFGNRHLLLMMVSRGAPFPPQAAVLF